MGGIVVVEKDTAIAMVSDILRIPDSEGKDKVAQFDAP
jgi:hypothetical protein